MEEIKNQTTAETVQKSVQESATAAAPRITVRQWVAQNRTRHSLLLLGLFVLAVVVFCLANWIAKDREFSDTENRSLAQRPAFSVAALADGSFFSEIDSWYNDQFMARDSWISMHLWEIRRLGAKESGSVYLGRDRLFSVPETPDEAAAMRTVEAVNAFAEKHPELAMRLMLVPGASAILKDDLPKHAPVRDQLQDIRMVRDQLSGSIVYLEAGDVLAAHADEEIYYRTDHHWTSLGAYRVYEANAALMDLTPASFDVYTVTEDFEGTLSSRSGSHALRDSVEVYGLKDSDLKYYVTYGEDSGKVCSIYKKDALEAKDKYTVFFGGNHDKVEIRTTANNGKSLLLFKDSYANCFVQFLLPGYERIIMIDPRYYYGTLDSILNAGVTDVLFLYSADTFVKDTSLADVLGAQLDPA